MKSFVVSFSALMLAFVLAVGCSSPDAGSPESNSSGGDSSADSSSGSGSTEVAFANTKCPMMGGDVDPSGQFTMYNGKKIGYCCDGCKDKFEALSDAEKDAKLANPGGKHEAHGDKHEGHDNHEGHDKHEKE